MTNESIAEQIKSVLKRYFEADENGNPNPEYDEYFSAQDALDEIAAIVR